MVDRALRLPEMLGTLINERGYARNRQPVLDAVDISAASLSQYIRGTTKPSFAKLLSLAEFFDVSLDYLVYGKPYSSAPTSRPELVRYIEDSFKDVQSQTAAHTALVGRMGRLLAEKIDEAALRAAPEGTTEGLIDDDELVGLEGLSSEVDVVTIDLDANIVRMAEGETGPGKFLEVVARALVRGCRYRFVVSTRPRTSDESVQSFRQLLSERVGGQVVHESCLIRRATEPTLLGMGLYKVDVNALRVENPPLFTQFETSLDGEGWFGYLIRPQHAGNRDAVMNARRRDTARALFEVLWSAGDDV